MSDATPQNRHTPRVAQALVSAVERGDAQEVASLLASGGFADARTSAGETPLMRAASKGFEDVAGVLLDAGADPRARRPDGFTPLILAAFFGHEETARLLLARGADPLARTSLGTTAAAWAASRGFERIAELIKEAEAATPPAPVLQKAQERPDETDETTLVRVEVVREVAEEVSARPSARRDAPVPFENFGASSPAGASGRFLRSWQGSIGLALLLMALGVGAFAVWRTTKSGRGAGRQPAPAQTPLQQAGLPQPTPDPFAPTPSPTPDLQGYVGPQGPIVVFPGTGEPVLVSPAAPPSTASGVPALISESGGTDDGSTTRRQPTPTPTPRAAEPSATPTPRPADERRADPAPPPNRPEPQPRPTGQPAAPSATPPPAPTPERRKVIPWPPQ